MSKGSATISLTKRMRVYERDNFTCQECEKHVSRERTLEIIEGARKRDGRFPRSELLTIDHIYPRSKGGHSDDSNLQTLCYECNMRKANKVVSHFPRRTPAQTKAEKKSQRGTDRHMRLGASKPFRPLAESVRHKRGCDPTAGCVDGCPVQFFGLATT